MSAVTNVIQRLNQYNKLLAGASKELLEDWIASPVTGATRETDFRVLAVGNISDAIECVNAAIDRLEDG